MGRGPEDQSRPNGRAMLVPRAAWRRACGARASGVEDRDEPAARQCACGKRERRVQAEPLSATDGRARAWMGQGGAARADAPHASSRARRVERRLVGASVGAFGRRNASTACQRDGLVPRNCNAPGSRTSPGGPPGQIWARPSPRAVAASNRGLERGWSAGWGRRLQRRRGRARGCKCATRARRPGPGLRRAPQKFCLLRGSPLSQAAPLHPVSRGSRP